MLPDGLLPSRQTPCVGWAPERVGAMLGEAGLDQAPAGGEVDIAGRQRPDAVQVIGHHDDGVDLERARSANRSEGLAQHVDGLDRSQDGATAIGNDGEEEGAAGGDGASISHGGSG